MRYIIEISFKIKNDSSFNILKNNLFENATIYNCSSIYNLNETEGENNKIKINNYITIITFNDKSNLFLFIDEIKNNKNFIIDSVFDESIYKLLYASRYYLKTKVSKDIRDKYLSSPDKINIIS